MIMKTPDFDFFAKYVTGMKDYKTHRKSKK
jgi:hypothetical protein